MAAAEGAVGDEVGLRKVLNVAYHDERDVNSELPEAQGRQGHVVNPEYGGAEFPEVGGHENEVREANATLLAEYDEVDHVDARVSEGATHELRVTEPLNLPGV